MKKYWVVLFVFFSFSAQAATISPNVFEDQYNATPDSRCSLREAIQSINSSANFGGCEATGRYGEADEILLNPEDIYQVSIPNATGCGNECGTLRINKSLVLRSSNDSQKATIDANAFSDSLILGNAIGAVRNLILEIKNVRLGQAGGSNTTNGQPVIHFVANEGNQLILRNSEVLEGDNPTGDGGAIYFLGNASPADGSRNSGGLFLFSSRLVSNHAHRGGAVFFLGAVAGDRAITYIQNSFIVGNKSNQDGGGLYVSVPAVLRIDNSTIFGNTSDFDSNGTGSGGGIYLAGSELAPAVSATISNTIIHQNLDNSPDDSNNSGRDCVNRLFGVSALNVQGRNLIGTNTGCIEFARTFLSPDLSTPMSHFVTDTPQISSDGFPLSSSSVVLRGGLNCTGYEQPYFPSSLVTPSRLRIDYRGKPRSALQACDIGAIESCGDAIHQATIGEQCDDGNITSLDGCSSLCQAESIQISQVGSPPSVIQGGSGTLTVRVARTNLPTTSATTISGISATFGSASFPNGYVTSFDTEFPVTFSIGQFPVGVQTLQLTGRVSNTAISHTAPFLVNVVQGRCGDRVHQPAIGEQCDDGNTSSFDRCSATCQLEFLGLSQSGTFSLPQGQRGSLPINIQRFGLDPAFPVNITPVSSLPGFTAESLSSVTTPTASIPVSVSSSVAPGNYSFTFRVSGVSGTLSPSSLNYNITVVSASGSGGSSGVGGVSGVSGDAGVSGSGAGGVSGVSGGSGGTSGVGGESGVNGDAGINGGVAGSSESGGVGEGGAGASGDSGSSGSTTTPAASGNTSGGGCSCRLEE